QLLGDLRRRLGGGELDESFPAESELAAAYAVSRNTVREAMRRLRAEGTVIAERGRRPRLGREIRQPLGSFYSLFEAVRAAGLEQRSIVRRLEIRRDGEAAARLGLEPQAPLVHLDRLRLADDEPLALDRIWLPGDVAGGLLDADLERRGFYEELARLTGLRLTGGEEHLRAVVPTAGQRRELSMPRAAAAFAIERLGRVGERSLEWRVSFVRADRFSVVAAFSVPAAGEHGGGDLLAAAMALPPARSSRR
ncbi:MAG TPA: GntR family transcriptional regulator, partial [Acidimicrobiales bacterium]|nr:GntR family transcriptional regulator [Acidimicrobiales bacterium]